MNKHLRPVTGLLLAALLGLAGCGSDPKPDPTASAPFEPRFESLAEAESALRGDRNLAAIRWMENQARNPTLARRPDVLRKLAEVYARGEFVPQDQHRAAGYFFELAKLGDTDAQAEMAHRFHHGLGVTRNLGQSVHWARKAAEAGNAEGQLFLGWAYEHGAGLPQNYDRAARLYENAAAQDNAAAMYHLGTLYQRGRVFASNNERAITLYQQSAERNYGPAFLALGMIHLIGDGVPRDPDRALELFMQADRLDVAEGAYQAARLIEGRGDRDAARDLYRRAYRLGKVSAMNEVRRLDGRPLEREQAIGG